MTLLGEIHRVCEQMAKTALESLRASEGNERAQRLAAVALDVAHRFRLVSRGIGSDADFVSTVDRLVGQGAGIALADLFDTLERKSSDPPDSVDIIDLLFFTKALEDVLFTYDRPIQHP